MKKMISLLMAVVLVFTLAACSSGPEILGTYKTNFDMTDLVVEEFDGGAGTTGTDLTLANYLDDFSLTIISEFKEDGTYIQTIDTSSLETVFAELKTAVVLMMDDFMLYSFINEFSDYGYSIETREDVEELVGMEWDDIFSSVMGMSSEEFVQDLIDQLSEELLAETLIQEGQYKAEGGKLYLSYSLDEEIIEESYEVYEIDGDVVTVTSGVNVEENEYFSYPFTLTKVS